MSAAYHYPTDVTDEQWELLQANVPPRAWRLGGRGRPPSVDTRQVVDGIMYLNKTGCQWRMLPPAFGNWSTVYGYFKRWRCNGTWATLMETLRQLERRCQGKQPEPSAGSIDSQSIKAAGALAPASRHGHALRSSRTDAIGEAAAARDKKGALKRLSANASLCAGAPT